MFHCEIIQLYYVVLLDPFTVRSLRNIVYTTLDFSHI